MNVHLNIVPFVKTVRILPSLIKYHKIAIRVIYCQFYTAPVVFIDRSTHDEEDSYVQVYQVDELSQPKHFT